MYLQQLQHIMQKNISKNIPMLAILAQEKKRKQKKRTNQKKQQKTNIATVVHCLNILLVCDFTISIEI